MEKPICPKCRKSDYAREKRPNGDTTCNDCGYKGKSSEWDKSAPIMTHLRNEIETVSNQYYDKMLEQQKGHTDEKMLNMLSQSDYFRGMFSEAFVSGVYYSQKLEQKYKDVIFVKG